MKVVKCMPLSYVNLKTKLKCFLAQLSLTWYRSTFHYLKNNNQKQSLVQLYSFWTKPDRKQQDFTLLTPLKVFVNTTKRYLERNSWQIGFKHSAFRSLKNPLAFTFHVLTYCGISSLNKLFLLYKNIALTYLKNFKTRILQVLITRRACGTSFHP